MIDPEQLKAFANPGGEGDVAPTEDMEENGSGRFGALIPLLEAGAEDLVERAEEMDGDALRDPTIELDPEEQQILQDGYSLLDRRLQQELRKVGAISFDEAVELARHLQAEGMIDDPDRVAGYLARVSAMLHGEGESGEEGEAEEEEEEEEGEAEEEMN